MSEFLASPTIQETWRILKNEFLFATWETFYVTVLATLFAIILGLPLGVLLVAGEENGVMPIPKVLLHVYSLLLVVIGWGIFYFDDFGKMTRFFEIGFGQAATLHDFTVESALLDNFWLWVVGIVFCLPVYDTVAQLFHRVFRRQTTLKKNLVLLTRLSVSAVLLLVSVALLVGATNNAFIYTRF